MKSRLPTTSKIRHEHLERHAYVYIRQSTLNQIRENTTSTQRQYELAKLAADLGWEKSKIIVVVKIRGTRARPLRGGMVLRECCPRSPLATSERLLVLKRHAWPETLVEHHDEHDG